jgi:ribosomal protein S18 acetylase RimI-like enzyme
MKTELAQEPRPYRGPDELEKILHFVGECNVLADFCVCAHPGDVVHFMSNALRGRDIERYLYLYEDADQRLLALIMLYKPTYGGYDLLVHPAYREGELEKQVVDWSEQMQRQRIQESESKVTQIASDVLDQDGRRRDLLLAAGYVADEQPFMCVTMRSLFEPIADTTLPDGFTIRRVEGEHEADALGEVHSSAFGSNWPPGAYLNVMRTPGFRIDHELVVVAPDGRLAAFLIYWVDPVSRCGLFEPVGCHRDFQRRGLTKALMYQGMRYMLEEGMTAAMVIHEAENPASTALYRSVGFGLKYNLFEYRKAI